jgi:hypothetical protein
LAGFFAAIKEYPGFNSKPIFNFLFGTILNQNVESPSLNPVTNHSFSLGL